MRIHLQTAERGINPGEPPSLRSSMLTTHRRTGSTSSKRSSTSLGRLLHCTRSSSIATATASDNDEEERPARGQVTTEDPLHWVDLFDVDRHDEAGRVCISSWEALAAVAAVDPVVSTLAGSQVLI